MWDERPHIEETIINGRREAPFGKTNIVGMKDPTTANIIEQLTVVGMIIGGMRHTPFRSQDY